MTAVSAAQVATEVKRQGGTDQQAWVAAALVSGIESNGQSDDKTPTSTACGLFQFLTTTWASNGGTKYAPTACQASWQQQVSVFLTASQGNNFYPWSPDLGGSYNGVAIYGPKSGSKVANKISELSASGQMASAGLGNVPTGWADAGGVSPTTGLGSLIPGGGSSSASNNCTPVISGLSVTVLNSCQAQELLGGILIAVGAIALVIGLRVILTDAGLKIAGVALAPGAKAAPPASLSQSQGDEIAKNATLAERSKTEGPENRKYYNEQTKPKMTTREPRPHRVASSSTPDF